MKKERSINELLKLMLDHQDQFVNGLCGWSSSMMWANLITASELMQIRYYIDKNQPKNIHWMIKDSFYWTPGKLSPRVKWLQKHIKLTNKQ